jgi:DNA-binding response OmpR family regulator
MLRQAAESRLNTTGDDHRRWANLSRVRALLVEDEANLALGVSQALRSNGWAVDVEHDGHQGLVAAQSAAYDVIVLDVMLPGMNGLRVCASLREADDWTPILMLTAKDGEHDVAEGLDTGADDYLTKPFPIVVLLARLNALVRRPRTPGSAPFVLDDLRVDPQRHRCWRGEDEVDLSGREIEVLTHLLARPGETVSKQQLLDNVWGQSFAGDPNIVEVYIRRLRRKVDVPFGRDSIQTVRGVGYVLRPQEGRTP